MLNNRHAYATIPAADFARAKSWYRDKLGLSPKRDDEIGAMYELASGSSFLLYPTQFAGTAQNTAMASAPPILPPISRRCAPRAWCSRNTIFPGLKTVNGVARDRAGQGRLVQGFRGQYPGSRRCRGLAPWTYGSFGTWSSSADRFSGQIITPDDGAYDEARTIFNAMIERRPRAHRAMRQYGRTWSAPSASPASMGWRSRFGAAGMASPARRSPTAGWSSICGG